MNQSKNPLWKKSMLKSLNFYEIVEFLDEIGNNGDPYGYDREKAAKLVGVVQLARPVSRMLDDGKTIEVVRLCTDGTPNVCSFLYSRAARIAKEMGYRKIITYILDTERGASLKACGWHKEADTHGHDWSCRSRPRNTTAPTCNKQRWAKDLKS